MNWRSVGEFVLPPGIFWNLGIEGVLWSTALKRRRARAQPTGLRQAVLRETGLGKGIVGNPPIPAGERGRKKGHLSRTAITDRRSRKFWDSLDQAAQVWYPSRRGIMMSDETRLPAGLVGDQLARASKTAGVGISQYKVWF